MCAWIINNKEWIFSGIGITIIAAIIAFFKFLFKGEKKPMPKTPESNTVSSTIHGFYNPPYTKNDFYTGRNDFPNEISKILKKGKLCILTGYGGIGKTQIALQYCFDNEKRYGLIFWLNAETVEQLEQGFMTMSQNFGLIIEKMEINEIIENLYRYLNRVGTKTLIVIDNYDDIDVSDIQKYIPRFTEEGIHILVTSRIEQWNTLANVESLAVDVWESAIAKEYILKRTKNKKDIDPDEDTAAGNLAEKLGCLPLAVDMAVSYIKETGISIQEYNQTFDYSNLADEEDESLWHKRTVIQTWQKSVDRMKEKKQQAALNIFYILSFMASAIIPCIFFEAVGYYRKTVLEAVRELRKYSFVLMENDYISVHKIVQEITREYLDIGQDKNKTVEKLTKVMSKYFNFEEKHRELKGHYADTLPHAISILSYSIRINGSNINQSILSGNIGLYLYSFVENYDLALDYLTQALTIDKEIGYRQGEATQLGNIGLIYYAMGEAEKTLDYHQQALTIDKEIGYRQGEAAQLGNIGLIYHAMGKAEKALDYHQQALTIDKEIGYRQGEASDLSNIGLIYSDMGKTKKALDYHRQALTIDKEIGYRQGEASDLGNIGLIYHAMGEAKKALDYHQQALTIHKEIGYRQGEATQLGNIGLIYYAMGEAEKALDYHQQALTIHKEIGYRQGEATQLGNIGLIYSDMGEAEKALDYHQQALTIYKEIGSCQGEASDLGNIGLIYRGMGEAEKALDYFKQALTIHKEIGYRQGEASQLGNIGLIYRDMGEAEKALDYFKQALTIHKEIGYRQGEATQLGNIGLIYYAMGEAENALDYLIQANKILDTYSLVYGKKIILKAIEDIEGMHKKTDKSVLD
jgi:tetratricopeptide (TPR) repeat protein